ncbi:ATP-binding protein [Bosea sp. (in: a-proteobacteria)]|uniref:ATP-binding protein n=1 Tax=Bosea sp. (in: a-proteobacteria) TaxID=1871050 RepID=UPI002B48DEF1|nr:ATP-binding protein [Bosea sp. (in: a-proteobacteria)]WRH60216.1 MAG: ATP-binding protein [Bosea sp. (in: a-proteobacteria)]
MEKRPNPNRLNNLGILALLGVSLLLGVVVIATFSALGARHRATEESVREDVVWAAYQLDREVKKLGAVARDLKDGFTAERRADVTLRYDILYSRRTVLTSDHYRSKFGQDADIIMLAEDASQRILRIAPLVDALERSDLQTERVDALLGELASLAQLTERLLNTTNLAQSRIRVQDRAEMSAAYHQLGGAMTALIASLALIVMYLGVQLYHIRIARRRFEKLSIQNAKAAKRAEAGARAKSIFLATMSHEIRTPLNGIIGMVDIMRESAMDPTQRERLGVIGDCSDTLLALIDDILDYSKLESGAVDFEIRPFDLGEVCSAVANVMGRRAEDKGIALQVEHPPAMITTDPTRLRQLLFNLVGNAVKFTDTGWVRLVCSLEAGNRLRVEVEDTGIGIPEAARERLFQDFSQLDVTINRRFGGSGLGLAICRRLIGSLGGEIGVASREGRGTRFWFTLPVGPISEPKAKADLALAAATPGRFAGRVLVAEDNPINFAVASEMLQRLGLQVDHAPDGRIAAHLAAATPYDLILMDMQMPLMSGLEATRAIRQQGLHDLPIVGLTANAFASDREACLEAGMSDFVAKPISRAKMTGILAKWLPQGGRAAMTLPASSHLAPPPVDDGLVLVDQGVRAELAREIGGDLLDELTRQFWPDATRSTAEAARALQAGETDLALRELHTLKGIAGTLGFSAFEADSRAAEAAIRSGRDADLTGLQTALLRTMLALGTRDPGEAATPGGEAMRAAG